MLTERRIAAEVDQNSCEPLLDRTSFTEEREVCRWRRYDRLSDVGEALFSLVCSADRAFNRTPKPGHLLLERRAL